MQCTYKDIKYIAISRTQCIVKCTIINREKDDQKPAPC